jgi:MinD-like ATPase involved in chromosome partitioning or flagellar assembly
VTERQTSDGYHFPEGSVGRYVRERWGVVSPAATRPYVSPPAPRPVPESERTAPGAAITDGVPEPEADTGSITQTGPLLSGLPRRVPGQAARQAGTDRASRQVQPGVLQFPHPPVVPDARPHPEPDTASVTAPGPPVEVPPARASAPPAVAAELQTGPPTAPTRSDPSAAPVPTAPVPTAQVPTAPVPTAPVPTAPEPGVPDPAAPDPAAPDPGPQPPTSAGLATAPALPGDTPGPPPTRPTSTGPRRAGRWTDPGAVAAQEAQRARSSVDGLVASELSSARLLRPSRRVPQSGWRRAVYLLSLGLLNPGESPAEVRHRMLTVRANQPLHGCYKIAMLSLKGGVGKTTITATLGATFASLRGDRVVAVDANPDRGTLSQKIPLETSATVRHLLRDAGRLRRYSDVRSYTSQGASRLEVLASEQDPAVSEAFSEDDYRNTVNLLEHFYNIVLTDCGTGLMHSAMYGVLGVADQLIVVSSGSIDGARSASATMDWLDAHGHGNLVRNSVVVINCVHRSAGGVDLDRVAAHFAARCRGVVRVPFDPHLEEGAELDLDRIDPATRGALLELAAAVADAFDRSPG